MKVMINLGTLPIFKRSRALALAVHPALEALVQSNCLFLSWAKAHGEKVPPLYQSGVRYREEPEGTTEEFASIPVIYERKWGDCDDLAPARVAELRMQGENAKIRVTWKMLPNGRLYHVTVRRGDGSIEDPSEILGMRSQNRVGARYRLLPNGRVARPIQLRKLS